MKALVTGSTGFIGSHLVEHLVRQGHDVRCLVRQKSDTRWLRQQSVSMVTCDYEDISSLAKAVQDVEVVFHLAARIQAPAWEDYYKANTSSTKNLLDACLSSDSRLKRFVFVSSISASGPSQKGVLKKESDTCCPASMYGRSKLMAEEVLREFSGKISWVIVRPPNVLGVRQEELLLSLKTVKSRILPMIGNGDLQTSLCFVDDLVRALVMAAEDPKAINKTYFVTDGHTYSWRTMLVDMAKELGVYPFVLRVPYPFLCGLATLSEAIAKLFRQEPMISRETLYSSRDYYWTYDGSKIKEELGFEPRLSFEEGLRRIIADYRQSGCL